ncbi:MAG: M48 family metalloprotease [Desulfobacterales bacterium]|nr:M48 family metalloprotease [Desulfobacterales bacterium]
MDEISAVIGHEMGHSQLRHIPENYDTQKSLSVATILGVLAGSLLSSKNPEAGAAMIFSSIGGSENVRLAYSRKNEYESDNYGKVILQASGIDPSAMSKVSHQAQYLFRHIRHAGIPSYPPLHGKPDCKHEG